MSTRLRRPPAGDGLFVLGLVGPPGSGKSTVARALRQAGAEVLEADAIGHAITDGDPEVRAALEAEYGAGIYGHAGLDRARVAARVFADRAARERLNRLVHPRIVRDVRERIESLRRRGFRGLVVVDAALLLDWGFEGDCDGVLAVVAPLEARLERLRTQRGWSRDEAERRTAAQRPAAELARAADVTLENTGTPEQLERAAREAVERLRESAENPKGPRPHPC